MTMVSVLFPCIFVAPVYAETSSIDHIRITVYYTLDTTAPTVSTLSPTDNATGVSLTANLVITFDEVAQGGTGSILIKKTSDNSTVETISANGGLVSGSGTTSITINPSTTLAESTSYYITIDGNAFQDGSGNDFAAITSATTWNFTTGEFTDPTVQSFSPADESTGISPTTTLVITFSEAVTAVSGNITIKKTSDNSTVETIGVTSGQVSGSGTAIITITPVSALINGTSYYVQIASTAFDDLSGNSYAGISDTTTWNFTTTSAGGSQDTYKRRAAAYAISNASHSAASSGSSSSTTTRTGTGSTISPTTGSGATTQTTTNPEVQKKDKGIKNSVFQQRAEKALEVRKERICTRVELRLGKLSSVFERVNKRLLKWFGFEC